MRVFEYPIVLGAWLLVVCMAEGSESQEPPIIFDVTTIYRLDEPLPPTSAVWPPWAMPVPEDSQPEIINDAGALLEVSFVPDAQTTINHPGTMEVHARTNARGLPFRLRNGTILGPNVGVSLPDWLTSNETASGHNFTWADINTQHQPSINLMDEEFNYQYGISPSSESALKRCAPRRLEIQFEITYRNGWYSVESSELRIFLFENRQNIHEKNHIYLLRFVYHQALLYECDSSLSIDREEAQDIHINVDSLINNYCHFIQKKVHQWDFAVNGIYSVAIDMGYHSLTVTDTTFTQPETIFDWPGLNSTKEIIYFSIGSYAVGGHVTVTSFSDKGLVLDEPTGSLVSLPLPPALDRVCVSLIFYSSQAASIDLHLQQGNSLSPIGKARPKGGWTHQVLVAEIPETSDIETRVVITATRPENETLIIKRIVGCNTEDAEDVLDLQESTTVTSSSRGIDVAHNTHYRLSPNNTCINGGIRVKGSDDNTEESAVCICPPGFTGDKCSEGCGANSYGADCGGVCSGTEGGCRGVVMCRPMMDCDCAPGFKGPYCDKNCEIGEYGVGCRQSCGKCETESCDIYTGICHQGCQPGFIQPYCKDMLSYLSTAPQVVVNSSVKVTVSGNLAALEGQGVPRYYQLQYKKNGTLLWHKETPQQVPEGGGNSGPSTLKLGDVTGLEQGTDYEMRVVMIDVNLASYQGELVPSVAFSTPCIIPKTSDYAADDSNKISLKTNLVEDTGFEVEWKIPSSNASWCRLVGYEVHLKVDWRWVTHRVGEEVNRKHVTGLLPGRSYAVKVRAITSRGPAAFSKPLAVTTIDKAPDHVVSLEATAIWERGLKVTWEPPRHPAGTIRRYHISYQCVGLGACPEEDCSDSAGEMDASSTSQLIEGLLPFAVYNISVTGFSGSLGPAVKIQAATLQSLPDVAPSSVSPAITGRTNTSLKVHWAPPGNCTGINGYLSGYRYELVPAGQATPLFVGTTPDCNASFNNLTPHAQYVARVFVVTGAGWSSSKALEITATTRATTPEAVQDLVVYKRGRRLLGLRWGPPRTTYGSLQSFTIRHTPVGGAQEPVGVSVKPTPCPAWPRLFCHTLNNLEQDTDYTISVQARNAEVHEDGEEVTVTAITRESAPGAPSFLRVPTKTSDSLTIEWGLPDFINGQLRSFLVNIEETDSHNSSDCCRYFPIREVVVTSERLDYELHMTGLRPASTYEISLSAKTVAMGPAVTLTVHTRPPTPVLVQAPRLDGAALLGGPLRVRIETQADIQGDLVSGYLLLLKDDSSVQRPPLRDEWLGNHLTQALNGSFSLAAEFTKGNMPEGGIVELHPGGELKEGVFGRVWLPELKPDSEYQLVWVVVLEYCKTLSEGHIISETFTLKQA